MRFRNYMNRKNRKNRIYSEEDLLKMQLGNLFDIEEDILAQDDEIGIPTLEELEQSPNTEWIEPYINEDGIEDGGFWQSVLTPMKERSYPQTEPTDSFAPESPLYKLSAIEVADNLNTEDEEEKWEPSEYQLEGGVSKTRVPVVTDIADEIKNTAKKYEGLDIWTAGQKAASKLPIDTIEREYYGLQSHLKDNEEIPQKVLEENNIFRYGEIEDRLQAQKYTEDLAKMYGLDPKDPNIEEKLKGKVIVEPKSDSRISQYIKNSDVMQQWVADNYDRLKNGDIREGESIEFPKGVLQSDKRGLYLTLHKAGIDNIRFNEDGSMYYELKDPDNYEYQNKTGEYVSDVVKDVNNRAYKQQEAGQLENLLFSISQTLTKEEIEEILKRYGKR